ncbi:Jag N-terminal domain-containing protein [Limosilactobacillus sp. STM2_1]|uniref:RNA-binding protein KhpB n=1 Tax=Limosilactobacillus rudii TaxID=2759755 RepID=A0A7W3UJ70_9LACO|nr:RNA-binding cell elongation regulator Jag/EloR [Limosilactobacillus rudii]MBB1078459.1 Jag N-terminal domain-containing protein [Limosilactobacillus rudii]MBB1096589.1 Jag N-terminal domain-containing protein [Limosilactobacillus rudii]MCD7134215.1 Jag N-terminal domain-containing protein [Limosilactobacillus rudii]
MTIFVGKTIEEAKQKAIDQLKPTANQELEIKILQQPRRGFLGIGRRQAKMAITIKEKVLQKKIETPVSIEPKKKVKVKKSRPIKDAEDGELDPAEIRRRQQANLKKVQKTSHQLENYLINIFKELGITVKPKLTDLQVHELHIDLVTDESGRVIGKHGRRINAVEQLSNAFMDYHGAPKVSVFLNTSNYRQRRQETVHRLAEKAVTEVIASGKAVFLDPMPARERKQIHQELEANDRVKTYSHGREPYRSIVVAPKN